MNYTLLRSEYYNEDHKLSIQEEKEFYLPLETPFYKLRNQAYYYLHEVFGTKEEFSKKISQYFFESENPNKNYSSNTTNDILEENFHFLIEKKEKFPIYNFIPELKDMKKNLSYEEIYSYLSNFCDPQMLFINVFKEKYENNLINAIIYFPYTPEDLQYFDKNFLKIFCKNFSININFNNNLSSEIENKILIQKLYEIFYLVEDSPDLTGITDCHNIFNFCPNLSSFYCSNHLCKKCCEISAEKKFCVIHDDIVNYLRLKLKQILNFEFQKNFNCKNIIRISVTNNINKLQLKNFFFENNFEIEIVDFLFNDILNRIQYVYVSSNDAKKIYQNRHELQINYNKNFNSKIYIQSLLDKNFLNSIKNYLNSSLLVFPSTSFIKNLKTIKKNEKFEKLTKIIENSLHIDKTSYNLTQINNILSSENLSYEYFLVEFNNKTLNDKFYFNQPYENNTLIVHKMNHLIFFPIFRNKSNLYYNLCINCTQKKNPKCLFDLCIECCEKFKENSIRNLIESNLNTKCSCSNFYKNNIINNNNNKISQYTNYLKNISTQEKIKQFFQNYNLRKSNIKLIIMNSIRNNDFNFFRPIYDTDLTRLMLDMNKEFTIIMDNPSYKRENPLKINDKMYKVFTYQLENKKKNNYENYNTIEGFDEKGDYYIEYDFDNETNINEKSVPKVYVEIKNENFQCIKNYNNLLFDYHICFYGLDNERYTNFELIDEIFHEIKSTITRFSKEDIQILDEQSVLTYCLLNNINEIKTDKFYNYGRFALVKFKNDKDALRIYLEKTVLHLPLINQRNGSPFMIMGGLLKKYIEE